MKNLDERLIDFETLLQHNEIFKQIEKQFVYNIDNGVSFIAIDTSQYSFVSKDVVCSIIDFYKAKGYFITKNNTTYTISLYDIGVFK